MDDKRIETFNKVFKDKTLQYKGYFNPNTIEIVCKFKIRLTDFFTVITAGVPVLVVGVELKILSMEPDLFITLFNEDTDWQTIKKNFYYFTTKIEDIIQEYFKYFEISYAPIVTKIITPKEKNQIQESRSQKRDIVRTIVQDIVKTFKDNGDGYYSLPEDLSGEMTYQFDKLNTEFTVELSIEKSNNVEGIEIDGGFYEDEDTIEVQVTYNPSFFPQIYYDLVGQLNDLIRHELQHMIQSERGEYLPKKVKNPEKYYMQPHEIEAQISGIKRLSKLKNEPFEVTLRDWFYKNESKHGLTQNQSEKIIQNLLKNERNTKK
jgi:hypothetical protein